MSENAKTLAFVVVGMLAIGLGIWSLPSSVEVSDESLIGTNLTKDFDSFEKGKRLKIVEFDEDTAAAKEFVVAERDGLWSIPSQGDYPADASHQLAKAATALMDREILQVASKSADDHELFGVIDPTAKLKIGQEGVGKRVTMFNDQDKPLVDLVIGKSVKSMDVSDANAAHKANLHYVREAGRDVVYVVDIDPAAMSTDFKDWIDKDLLKLSSSELKQLSINDHSAKMVPFRVQGPIVEFRPVWDRKAEMTFARNDAPADEKQPRWNAVTLRSFDKTKGDEGEYVDFTLSADEEIDGKALDELASALGQVRIVDLEGKPPGLTSGFVADSNSLKDLASKGFIVEATTQGGPVEIYSSHGEVVATMKNGTEYVLRFGDATHRDSNAAAESAGAAEDPATAAETKDDSKSAHRYVYVTARFNEGAVDPAQFEKLPDLPTKINEPAKVNGESGDAAATENTRSEPAANSADAEKEKEQAAGETAETAKAGAADAAAEKAKDEAKAAEAKDAGAAKAEEAKKAEEKHAADKTATDAELEKITKERERITKSNAEKMALLRQNVEDLKRRFDSSFFVVDEATFEKIHLSRDELIKKKEPQKPEGEQPAEGAPAAQPAPGSVIPGLPTIPGAKQ
jgi:hypothetical protein